MNIDLPAKFWRSRECTRVLAHALLFLDGIWGVYICLLLFTYINHINLRDLLPQDNAQKAQAFARRSKICRRQPRHVESSGSGAREARVIRGGCLTAKSADSAGFSKRHRPV